jgi:hypothetical protein
MKFRLIKSTYYRVHPPHKNPFDSHQCSQNPSTNIFLLSFSWSSLLVDTIEKEVLASAHTRGAIASIWTGFRERVK